MPPRKSTASNPPEDGADPAPAPPKASKDKDGLGVDVRDCGCLSQAFLILTASQDLTLPKSMIARLAKGVLPANTQIQKDALLAMHKSATVFVSYIASK
jgi:DNA polymerase epsilon subunit 3